MKVAFVGKGGSGKTTLASLFTAYLVERRRPVLAIDADINQHLAVALGATEDEAAALPTLGDNLPLIKRYLCGDNPRITAPEAMIKTTPPGRGSTLVTPREENPITDACFRDVAGARLAVTGRFADDDLGVACYHSKVGAAELLLNHMIDGKDEYVVMDMTAGADAFASGLFTRFDVTFLVCEPTVRSVGVFRQYTDYARDFGIRLAVIGNKVNEADDVEFLHDQVGEHLLGWISGSRHVRAAERGAARPIGELERENLATLDTMLSTVDATERDWARYQRQAVEFHLRNANAWAGSELAEQVDPGFVLSPLAPALG
ncbi:ATP-binding protein [Prauserella marina]|uniref:CO dehydrogenase maturation factor n=1 Tax=Prauserella marina TaxID=530584 RepID=A0A222VKE5_9PSEU|nr:ATP-binding protein [Prauserella marina]ASR34388.1 ATP-binding protein [Prauserella marina]PWV70571.1 CO dehydrogenase maturation factor [Prauserella marina]SDE02970.1 CO dehydrogenase maturation factor [Prauserella marina]